MFMRATDSRPVNPPENPHKSNLENDAADTEQVRYGGFNEDVNESITELARKITTASQISGSRSNFGADVEFTAAAGETISRVSTIVPGVNPMNNPDLEDRLNPESPEFNSRYWIKNFKSFMDKDPDYYKSYSVGVAYKNLRAYGNATDADYQSTVLNAPTKFISQRARTLFSSRDAKKKQQFDILKSMDLLVNPGEVVVVLGRPGSGCSTLLKTISSNTHGFHIGEESEISYGGLTPSQIKKNYRGEVVYNAETDTHFPHLTVWQTLSLAAKFRTPQNRLPGVTREQYANALTEVYMATYGLSHTKNTKVGNELVRGVSGGERKRVSIAEVSLSGARLQCWDNATRGLDAATALEFIRALRTQADILETTAFIAIYQCSQDAYDLFDKVSVLYEGHQIYFGRGEEAKDYFIRMGYECPARQTTADFLTSVTSPLERVPQKGFESKVPKTPQEFEDYWKSSPEYQALIYDINATFEKEKSDNVSEYIKDAHKANQAKHTRPSSSYTVSFWMQTRYCLKREFERIKNDFGFNLFETLANSIMALVLSSIFYNLQPVTGSFMHRSSSMFFAVLFNGFSSFLEIMSLFEARPIIEKHKQYALYHPSAASLASIIAHIPQKIITAVFFNLVYYFMVHYRRDPGRFFFYFLVNITATFTMSHFFRLIGSAASSLPEALVPAHVVLLALTMFVGFTIPVSYMLGWSRWINYIDPLAYAFEALMVNEFDGVTFGCSHFIPLPPDQLPAGTPSDAFICQAVSAQPGDTTVSGTEYLRSAFRYEPQHKWRNWGITLAFAIVLGAGYLLFSEYNESAKQKGEVLLFQKSTLKKLKKQHASIKDDLENGPGGKELTEQEAIPEEGQQNVESLAVGKDIFHWRDVHFTVKIKSEYREILSGVDGWVKPGTLTALMGATGAGKTTLLDVLANRVTTGVVTGNMFVNGRLRDSSFQRATGYVQQQDLHLETATVREALLFSAYLRQPFHISKQEKEEYVEEVIKILDMEKYADAVVGVAGEGLNVEQRKRLTIGVELAAKPKLLLFLDEPTSGLDSQTAWSICQLMRKLADHGQAILCTIHQPSAILMQEFDRLLFLAKGGKTIYFGDLGDHSQTLINYFESNGAPNCPPSANPVEWMLHVIGAAPGSHANQDYHEVWLKSPERQAVLAELDRMERELVSVPMADPDRSEFAAPLWLQYVVVTKRVFQQYWRSPVFVWSKMFLAVSSSLFIGFAIFNAKLTIQGLQNQMFALFMFTIIMNPLVEQILPYFVKQRDLYETRERPSKTFSWLAFMAAQITVEIPWNFLVGTIAYFTFYYPSGFYHNAEPTDAVNQRGAYAWLFSVVFFIYAGTLAHLVISPLELAESAGNCASLMFTLSLTFCGVLVTLEELPGFWKFMYYLSPFTYFISGFLSNALANAPVQCAENEYMTMVAPNGLTCGEYLADYIQAAGTGYLTDPNSTGACNFCPMSSTNFFLSSANLKFSQRWRNLGILFGYIVFDIVCACFFYWLRRVPKKNDRVKTDDKNAGSSPHTASSDASDISNTEKVIPSA